MTRGACEQLEARPTELRLRRGRLLRAEALLAICVQVARSRRGLGVRLRAGRRELPGRGVAAGPRHLHRLPVGEAVGWADTQDHGDDVEARSRQRGPGPCRLARIHGVVVAADRWMCVYCLDMCDDARRCRGSWCG
jgi:hypothetical protein